MSLGLLGQYGGASSSSGEESDGCEEEDEWRPSAASATPTSGHRASTQPHNTDNQGPLVALVGKEKEGVCSGGRSKTADDDDSSDAQLKSEGSNSASAACTLGLFSTSHLTKEADSEEETSDDDDDDDDDAANGGSSTCSPSSQREDGASGSDAEEIETEEQWKRKPPAMLPPPNLDHKKGSVTSSASSSSSVFSNPYRKAEEERIALLQRHVKLSNNPPKSSRGKFDRRGRHQYGGWRGRGRGRGHQLHHGSREFFDDSDSSTLGGGRGGGKGWKRRVGVSNSLIPPKKALKLHQEMQAIERPWTLR